MKKSFLNGSIGYALNTGGLLMKRELIARFKLSGHNVTPEQWAILSRLNEGDGVNQNELALITLKDNANITRIVDKLIQKKLVEKKVDMQDGRAWRIFITKSGKAMVTKLQPLASEVLKKATSGLSKDQVEKANGLIQKIIMNLQ